MKEKGTYDLEKSCLQGLASTLGKLIQEKLPPGVECKVVRVLDSEAGPEARIHRATNEGVKLPVLWFSVSSESLSTERVIAPVNGYRVGVVGTLIRDGNARILMKPMQWDVSITINFGFQHDTHRYAFKSMIGDSKLRSGLKFDVYLEELGLVFPVGVSVEPDIQYETTESDGRTYYKASVAGVLKAWSGKFEVRPTFQQMEVTVTDEQMKQVFAHLATLRPEKLHT